MSYTMLKRGLLGTKLGMTQVFAADGDIVPCTLVEAGPCRVTQKKTVESDGYDAIQLAYHPARAKVTSKPMQGHFKKAGVEPTRFLREVRLRVDAGETPAVGAKLGADTFTAGDFVDVIGTMKGRGFGGVVKRHGFATQKESHGAHYHWRHGGSIGCRKPEHTRAGARMAGHYGASRITVQNLKVVRVDAEQNLLYIRGAIPGPNGGMILIREAKKRPPKAAPASAAAPATA